MLENDSTSVLGQSANLCNVRASLGVSFTRNTAAHQACQLPSALALRVPQAFVPRKAAFRALKPGQSRRALLQPWPHPALLRGQQSICPSLDAGLPEGGPCPGRPCVAPTPGASSRTRRPRGERLLLPLPVAVQSLGRVRLSDPADGSTPGRELRFTPFALLSKRKITESSVRQEGRF